MVAILIRHPKLMWQSNLLKNCLRADFVKLMNLFVVPYRLSIG